MPFVRTKCGNMPGGFSEVFQFLCEICSTVSKCAHLSVPTGLCLVNA